MSDKLIDCDDNAVTFTGSNFAKNHSTFVP
jgi:hypothetical protein